jgi:hypothetical protein
MPTDASESHSHHSSPGPARNRVPDSDSSAPSSGATPGIQHWGRVYVLVLTFLALLIALLAWLTRIYS